MSLSLYLCRSTARPIAKLQGQGRMDCHTERRRRVEMRGRLDRLAGRCLQHCCDNKGPRSNWPQNPQNTWDQDESRTWEELALIISFCTAHPYSHMEYLDALAARFRRDRTSRLGFWKKIRRVQWTRGRRRAESCTQVCADVVAIEAISIGKGKNLCPDGTEGGGLKVFFASRV